MKKLIVIICALMIAFAMVVIFKSHGGSRPTNLDVELSPKVESRNEPSGISEAHAQEPILQKGKSAMDSDVGKDKKKDLDRRNEFGVLLAGITRGVSKNDVEKILGAPDEKKDGDSVWNYTPWYSSFIRVSFDKEGKVIEISSRGIDQIEVVQPNMK